MKLTIQHDEEHPGYLMVATDRPGERDAPKLTAQEVDRIVAMFPDAQVEDRRK